MKTDTKPATTAVSATPNLIGPRHPLVWTALLLAGLLSLFFWQNFLPNKVVFGNDDPLGNMVAEETAMPDNITGVWLDLNWLGCEGVPPAPAVTTALRLLTSPHGFLNLFYPTSLFIAGVCACFCFRQFKLAPLACVLGGLAAGLNLDFFSTACWGVASQVIGFGADYLALGLLAGAVASRRRWLKIILAGMAVGMNMA